jgi:hypothetical protein
LSTSWRLILLTISNDESAKAGTSLELCCAIAQA